MVMMLLPGIFAFLPLAANVRQALLYIAGATVSETVSGKRIKTNAT